MQIWQMRWQERQVWGLICLVVVFNPITFFAWDYYAYQFFFPFSYYFNLALAGLLLLDAWAIFTAVLIGRKKMGLGGLFQTNAGYVGTTFLFGLLYMLAVNPFLAGHFQWIRVLLPIGNLLLLAKTFHMGFVQARVNGWRLRLRPLATSMFAIWALFFVLEGVFMFVARSQTNDNALASKIWFARYWEENFYGFREVEGEPVRALLGDSFVAGHGISDPHNRFGDLINKAHPKDIPFYNMGQNGASTLDEFDLLKMIAWPALQEIVLVWYVNDIQDVAREAGLQTGNEDITPPWPISLTRGSYLVNYLVGLFPDETAGKNYLDFLHRAYTDQKVMARYFSVCTDLVTFCNERKIKLSVVLFPMMNLVDGSAFAIDPVRQFWSDLEVPCLDLSPVFHPYSANELVVNRSDAHPNEFAHKLAADAIDTFLNVHQLLDDR